MMLFDLYLKRFDLTKGLLLETFLSAVWYELCRCDHSKFPPKNGVTPKLPSEVAQCL